MADLAELGIRISSEEAALADQRLDAFAASADRAENAALGLAGGARTASTAVATMNTAVRQQDTVLRAQQAMMRASTMEGLNLSRQFADIGVSAAMGMNPLMILIQQGPQIADVFQNAAAEGRNFNTVLAGLYARVAPLLVPLAAVATAVGVAAGAFALFNREIMSDAPADLSKNLGLAEEQLKRLEESGVSTSVTLGDTFKATFQEIGANIRNFMDPATDWLAEKWGLTLDSITEAAATGTQAILGFFLGTYRAVMATWRNFPAAFGDMVIQGANAAITALNGLINRAVDGLNWLDAKFAGGQMQIQHFAATLLDNPVAGAASQDAAATADAYNSAFEDVGQMMDNFAAGVRRRALENRVAAIREAAGDPNKGRQGKTDEERLAEETARYIQSLKDQAATLGLSAIAAKEYEIAQRAAKAAQVGMNDEVEEAGRLLIEKMKLEAANTRSTDDALEVIRLEARLIGAGNIERAVAIAQLQKMQELERAGVKAGDPGYDTAVQAAGQLARETGNLSIAQDRYNDSLRLTLDLARQIDDHVRDAANGLGDAFGPAGEAIGGVASSLTGLSAQLAEIAEVEAQMRRNGTLTAERQAMLERDRAQAQIANYGDMLSAAKGYFHESSDGYRVLQAAEQAFRLFQFAMSVQSMAQGAAETAISIAQSGSKAAASTAAGAAKMFEFLGPFAFPAVAAMLAVLVGVGLKSGGGGSSNYSPSAANDNTATDPTSVTSAVQAYSARDAQARDTAAASLAQTLTVHVVSDDEKFGAFVEDKAAPLAASAGVASFETSAKTLPTEGARRARQQFG